MAKKSKLKKLTSAKLTIHYVPGIDGVSKSFTINGVTLVRPNTNKKVLEVSSLVKSADGIVTQKRQEIPTFDILYSVFVDINNHVSIIPNIITKFDVVPSASQVKELEAGVAYKNKQLEMAEKQRAASTKANAEKAQAEHIARKEEHASKLGITVEELDNIKKKRQIERAEEKAKEQYAKEAGEEPPIA